MARARRAAIAALVLILTIAAVAVGATPARRLVAADSGPLAVVPWPAASGVVLAEVVTGGASASDEYVELTNRSSATVELAGLELVYVTSSGTTVTRKASWTGPRPLDPGRHLLVANVVGIFAASADATYSGGLSATGGAVAIRPIGSSAIDAVGWGDATNAFVEGAAAPAPPAGSSIERRPGGSGGNVLDTNDNASDWVVVSTPLAQNLAAPAVPGPSPSWSPSPSPSQTPGGTESPTPLPTESPTPAPTPAPTPSPTESPTPTSTPSPTESPTPSATPTTSPEPMASVQPTASPTPSPTESPTPTLSPSPTPTPEPTPSPIAIASARALPNGQLVTVQGVVTVGLGSIESGRSGFIQDATGGIGIYLDAAVASAVPSGTVVTVRGIVDERYAQRIVRAVADDIVEVGATSLPDPQSFSTGASPEPIEGSRVSIVGTVVEAPTGFADGLGLLVDDGSGPLRAIVAPTALGAAVPVRGDLVGVTGPLGQHDSSGTGTQGYRVLVTNPGELMVAAAPTPTPTPIATPPPTASSTPSADPSASTTPSPTPAHTVAPSLSPSPSNTPPSPSPSPSSTPSLPSIASIRGMAAGSSVAVQGVVTAEPGRAGSAALLAVGDGSGGIFVRLPEGGATFDRGAFLLITGKLADPYGQLEIRTAVGGIVPISASAILPPPATIAAADLGEGSEGRLATITGTIEHNPTKTTDGGLAAILVDDAGGRARVLVAGRSGVVAANLLAGHRYRVTGIVGQRASRKGALDGYRLWARDRADIVGLAGPSPSPSGGPNPSSTGGGAPTVVSIAKVLGLTGRTVAVEGVVTIPARLLDTSGRRIVIQDGTAAIEVRVPTGTSAPKPGRRIRVVGEVGRAYDAPRILAKSIVDLGTGTIPSPRALTAAPTIGLEWQLVRVAGSVLEVHRLGDRWRADLRVGSARVPVVGLAGAGIPSTALIQGRRATIVGIVRRAYPGSADRRFSVEPRSRSDVAIGGAGESTAPHGTGTSAGATAPTGDPSADSSTSGSTGEAGSAGAPRADLSALVDHLGDRVRVGGLIVDLTPDGFTLDDGSATGRIVLGGEAAQFLGLIGPGDAIEATGRVEAGEALDAPQLVVEAAADLVRAGDLGTSTATAQPSEVAPLTSDGPSGGQSAGGATREAGLGALPDPTVLGIGWIALLAGLSVAVTFIRRRRVRRALHGRIAARLAAMAGPPSVPRA